MLWKVFSEFSRIWGWPWPGAHSHSALGGHRRCLSKPRAGESTHRGRALDPALASAYCKECVALPGDLSGWRGAVRLSDPCDFCGWSFESRGWSHFWKECKGQHGQLLGFAHHPSHPCITSNRNVGCEGAIVKHNGQEAKEAVFECPFLLTKNAKNMRESLRALIICPWLPSWQFSLWQV